MQASFLSAIAEYRFGASSIKKGKHGAQPAGTRAKLETINTGVQALLDSHEDQVEALHSLNYGLLSSRPMDMRQLTIAIRRYLQLTKAR